MTRLLLPLLLASLALACGPGREVVMSLAPGVPSAGDCAPGASVCVSGAPHVCSSSHRLWPVMPPRPDGTPRVCPAGCVVGDAGVAYCAPEVSP